MLAAVCAIISDTLPFIQTTRFTLLIGLQNNICPLSQHPEQSWVVGHVLCLSVLNLVLKSKGSKGEGSCKHNWNNLEATACCGVAPEVMMKRFFRLSLGSGCFSSPAQLFVAAISDADV